MNNEGNSFSFLQQLHGEGGFGDYDNDGFLDVMAESCTATLTGPASSTTDW